MSGDRVEHSLPGVFMRGMLMGAADIVPGVSGGTIAFITGIYDRLLAAIAAFDLRLLGLLRRGLWAQAWRAVDASFLAVLFAGILCSVFTFAHVISSLLERQPLLLWSFFLGLIFGSGLLLLRRVENWSPGAGIALTVGVLTGYAIGLTPALHLPVLPPMFVLAGALTICATILPGISGSFILVLLGLYPALLTAVRDLHWPTLSLFAGGAGCGLLLFSRVLHYLLKRFHEVTLAALTGFLIGSVPLLWPWKAALEAGEALALLTPWGYAERVADPQLIPCLLLALLGIAMVWLIENRWGGVER